MPYAVGPHLKEVDTKVMGELSAQDCGRQGPEALAGARDVAPEMAGADEVEIGFKEIIGEGHFWKHQEQEPLFHNIYEKSLAQREEEVFRPELLEALPRFVVRNRILYWIDKGKGGDKVAQILVPRYYWSWLLEIAHALPMGGHLGRDKAEARLKQRVFLARDL